jgi:RNA polymerase sigma-70 factor (ECF subfamily)
VEDTRQSLLIRARRGDEQAWNRFADLYRPLIRNWLHHHGVARDDAEDLTQDVLLNVIRHLRDFEHTGQRGAFRNWLRTITVNRTRDFWKARQSRPAAASGDSALIDLANQMADPDSELSRRWDQQHDQYLLRCLLDLMELEFEAATVRAFRRLALDGASAEEVAGELGMSLGAVYVAKSRVLKRIREEAEGLID